MEQLAAGRPGYLGIESARDGAGFGITVSYWSSAEAIRAWRDDAEHAMVRRHGREHWYEHYELRVASVERAYGWDGATAEKLARVTPTMEGMDKLTSQQILEAGLEDWRKLAQALHARFLTGDFATGLGFVAAVAEAAEQANHHPDVTLTYPLVDVRLISHDVAQITRRDLDLARRISEIARERGIGAGRAP